MNKSIQAELKRFQEDMQRLGGLLVPMDEYKNISELNLDTAPEEDEINKPKHYMLDGLGIEAIDVIRAVLGVDGFRAFCRGNVLKYIVRADKKNHLEDYKKAKVYLTWLISSMELNEKNEEK